MKAVAQRGWEAYDGPLPFPAWVSSLAPAHLPQAPPPPRMTTLMSSLVSSGLGAAGSAAVKLAQRRLEQAEASRVSAAAAAAQVGGRVSRALVETIIASA